MTKQLWTIYQSNPEEILTLMRENSTDAAIFLKTPDTFSGFNATSRAILDELKKWHTRIRKHNSTEFHPTLLYSLDQLYDALKKYPSLNEETSSYSAIIQSLVFLSGNAKKGSEKYLYIYPYLTNTNGQIFPKIIIIAPQVESKTPMLPFRESCFNASVSALENFFVEKIKSDRSHKSFSPFSKNWETGEENYSPFAMSIEFELHDFIRKGFFENFYIPMTDFVKDAIQYGVSNNLLLEMTQEYHLIKDEPKVFDKDLFSKSEIYLHLKNQCEALWVTTEKKTEKYITDYSPLLQKKFKTLGDITKTEKDYCTSDEFLTNISELIANFPFEEHQNEAVRKFKDESEFAISILFPLKKEWAYAKNLRIEMAIVNSCQKLYREIELYIGTKLVLFELSLDAKLKESEYIPTGEFGKLKEKAIDGISSKFLFHVEKNSDGSEKMYISSREVIEKSIENLKELAKIDPNYSKQLQIATSLLHENKFFSEKEVSKHEIEPEVYEKKETLKPDLIHGGVGFSAFFLFFILLYLLFSNTVYLFIGLIISLVFGGVLSILSPLLAKKENKSSQKKNHELTKESSHTKKPKVSGESALVSAFEKIVFGKKYESIEQRIFDTNSLRTQIQNHLKEIISEVPDLAREPIGENEIKKLEEQIYSHSLCVIHIPLDLVVGKKSDRVILYKPDLRSVQKRKELAAYFRNKAERFGYDKDLIRYYNFIIHAIEIDFARYA